MTKKKSKSPPSFLSKNKEKISREIFDPELVPRLIKTLDSLFNDMKTRMIIRGITPSEAKKIICQHIDSYIKGLEGIKDKIKEDKKVGHG